ncbi:MAG: helix-turn-helix transcriptional regulator [Agathobacter sp.]|nr:helix-turn-helix transcriptional regulator [Agathobacter sp.]
MNQLGENIAKYRKAKGLSQEKVAEYMNVSRQAVTKWENNVSKPSSENLMKLSELFEISLDVLLDNKEKNELEESNISTNKASWFLIGISILCIIAYLVISNMLLMFDVGTLILIFVICFPIQLFLHIYFSNVIRMNSFTGLAGYDEKIEYNIAEVKKMLVQIDLQIGMLSTVNVFLWCVLGCANLKLGRIGNWLGPLLLMMYVVHFIGCILINNYKSIDKIFCKDEDKQRARKSVPVSVIYILLLLVGLGLITALFELKGIENNTMPAMKVVSVYVLGTLIATIGYFIENNNIKKWKPEKTSYQIKLV